MNAATETWPEVLTPDEASRFLRVSPATLRKAVKRGDFPVLHVADRWRISRTVLEGYLRGDTKREFGLGEKSRRRIIGR